VRAKLWRDLGAQACIQNTGSRSIEPPHDAALHPDARRIPFGENMTTGIFSFYFRSPPVIDAIIRTGIPSRQIR
jgi:hypothetical protein